MKKNKEKIKIVTHDQGFHADDVFAVSVLKILFEGNIIVKRTRDPKIIEKADFVLDIGGIYDGKKRFDHHQEEGAGIRENGAPFATFGLVWKKFGSKICGNKDIADYIDEKLVQFIDTQDNGVDSFKPTMNNLFPYTISSLVASMNPTWEEKPDYNKIFKEAVNFAEGVILREISVAKAKIKSEKFIDRAFKKSKDKRVIVLDGNYDWKGSINKYSEVLFVVYPKGDFWRANAVRKDDFSFDLKKPFPKEWAGKMNDSLFEVSGVSDAVFCHRKLFLTVARSKEGIMQLVNKALKN